jgi:multiple sugar transport system substrate-binding protein
MNRQVRRTRQRKAKTVAVAAAGLTLGLLLSACTSSSTKPSSSPTTKQKTSTAKVPTTVSHKKETITWWTWTSNPQHVIANFEKHYPWITVKPPPDYGQGATFYAKLTTALEGGTGPDVTQVEYDHLPQFIQAKDLVNIAPYDASYKKDYPTWVWNQVTRGSVLYGIPEDIGPMGLLYQPSVLKKYSLPVPTTWATFASDAVSLHKADPSQYLTYFPINDGDYLEGLLWQAGAHPYDLLSNGTWKIDLVTPTDQKVMEYWGKLVKEGAVPTADDFESSWEHNIATDKYVAFLGAAWSPTFEVASYLPPSSKQEYEVTAMPQWVAGGHSDANWGGSSNAVTKDAPKSLIADSALFAAFINTSKSGLALDEAPATKAGGGRGLFPGSANRAEVPEFTAPIPHFIGVPNEEFSKLANDVNTDFQWDPWDTEFDDFVSAQLSKAAAGKEAWSQVLPNTEQELLSYAKSAGYSVEK